MSGTGPMGAMPAHGTPAPLDPAVPDSAWRRRPDAWLARLEWPATGGRLTRESFPRSRALGGDVVVHNDTEAVVRAGRVVDGALPGRPVDAHGRGRVALLFEARVRLEEQMHLLPDMDGIACQNVKVLFHDGSHGASHSLAFVDPMRNAAFLVTTNGFDPGGRSSRALDALPGRLDTFYTTGR